MSNHQSVVSFDAEALFTRGYAYGGNECYEESSAETSLWTSSTNATMDDIPGTGRVLGSLLQYTGRIIDRLLWKSMMKMGYGVDAVKLRLKKHVDQFLGQNGTVWILSNVIKEPYLSLIRRDCKKVVSFARSRSDATLTKALVIILEFTTEYPFLRSNFSEESFLRYLKNALEYEKRGAGSRWRKYCAIFRKVILCLDGNDITSAVDGLQVAFTQEHVKDYDSSVEKLMCYTEDFDKSFVSRRYLKTALRQRSHLFSKEKAEDSEDCRKFWSKVCDSIMTIMPTIQAVRDQQGIESILRIILESFPYSETNIEGEPYSNLIVMLRGARYQSLFPRISEEAALIQVKP